MKNNARYFYATFMKFLFLQCPKSETEEFLQLSLAPSIDWLNCVSILL